MPAEEIEVKGIVLSAFPQGEYGRRLVLLTDRFGKLTVFASGAAKTSSHLIGATRPMTCAHFLIAKGRGAWNLHGVRLIASFDTLTQSIDGMLYAMYFLEFASYFAQEGMEEREARAMLNLIYVALSALQAASIQSLQQVSLLALIRARYELRMLVIEGEYTELPPHAKDETVTALWRYAVKAPLKKLFAFSEPLTDGRAIDAFIEETKSLLRRQIPYSFRALSLLEELTDSGTEDGAERPNV